MLIFAKTAVTKYIQNFPLEDRFYVPTQLSFPNHLYLQYQRKLYSVLFLLTICKLLLILRLWPMQQFNNSGQMLNRGRIIHWITSNQSIIYSTRFQANPVHGWMFFRQFLCFFWVKYSPQGDMVTWPQYWPSALVLKSVGHSRQSLPNELSQQTCQM